MEYLTKICDQFENRLRESSRTAINGTAAKAKANAVQGLPELIQTASNPVWEENKKDRHAANNKKYLYDI